MKLLELQSIVHFLNFLLLELDDYCSILLEDLIYQCLKLMKQLRLLLKHVILRQILYSVLLLMITTLEKSKLQLLQQDLMKKVIKNSTILQKPLLQLDLVKEF